jgi:Spy/CpxP family protein refolding chaperone
MIAFHPLRMTHVVIGVSLLAVTAAVLVASSTPSLGITCDDVRGLTRAEQNYWSKQLNLTPDQRHRIWVECYSQTPSARVIETNGNGFQPLTNRDR